MNKKTRLSLKLALQLTLAVVFDTVQQLAWKTSANSTTDAETPLAGLGAMLHEPLLALVACMMVLRLFNWLSVLRIADLSFAQPITALSYVTVTAASAILLHEALSVTQFAGIALILTGVWCISQTGFASSSMPGRAS